MLSELYQKRRVFHDLMRHEQIEHEMAQQRTLLWSPSP
jgi:hypothetical protein